MDERHVGRDTRLACVLGTMCGTAASVTAKFNIDAVPAFSIKQAYPLSDEPSASAQPNSMISAHATAIRQLPAGDPSGSNVAEYGRV